MTDKEKINTQCPFYMVHNKGCKATERKHIASFSDVNIPDQSSWVWDDCKGEDCLFVRIFRILGISKKED